MIGMLPKFLARFLEALGRHATWILFGGILLGLILPDLAALARPALAPTVALILAAALLRVDWAIMLAYARRPGVVLALAVWCMLVSPVVTWALVQALPLPPGLATAIILMAAAPPILGATGLALVLGLDGALAAVAGLLSTVVTPLSVPPLALALLGLELEVGIAEFMLRLAVVIGAALALVLVVKRLCRPEQLRAQAGRIDGLFVLFMLVFAVGIMDGVTAVMISDPGKAALWLGAAFIANPVLQVLGALAFAGLGRQRALTAGLLTGNCNMGILLAALPPGGNFDIVLYFALGQLPMFMLPALLTPSYRRLLAPPRR
jgi:BASS family bile acid:Na+ symporter